MMHHDNVSDNEFLSARTWARRWDCSVSSIRRAVKRFDVRRVYVGDGPNGLVRYALEDIIRVEKENGLEPGSPGPDPRLTTAAG